MKQIVKTVLVFVILAVNFYACNEETSDVKHTNILSVNELKQIGKFHNDILKTSFDEFDYLSEHKTALIIKRISNNELIDLPEHDKEKAIALGAEYSNQFLLKPDNRTSFFKEAIENSKLVAITKSAEGYLYEDLDHDTISSNLNALINEVYAINASSKEKNAVLVYLEVLRYSTYFWMPKERGGEGSGYTIMEKMSLEKKGITCVEAIGAADAAAAGAACLSYGISAFFGPVGAAALAVSVTVASATASGLAAGSHPSCKKK